MPNAGLRWLLLIVVVGAGCIGGAPAAAGQTLTFSFWGAYTDLEFWKTVIQAFEAEHPGIEIVTMYSPYEYGEKLQLQLISNSAADIILMDDESYATYAARGYLEDLGPYMSRDRAALHIDDYFPTALKAFTYRGLTAGLPWGGFSVVMFYNKDLFDAAGIPYPEPDWTWAEFREIAKALTRDTDDDGRLDQFGNLLGFGFLDIEPVIWGFGGRLLNEDYTRAAVNSEEVREALQFLQDMKFVDRSSIWFGEYQGMMKEVQLGTGKIGMTMGGWYSTQIFNEIPELRWGVAPMPVGPRGERATRVSWDGISINAGSSPEKKAAAWLFCRYLLTEPIQKLVAASGRSTPVVREFARRYFVDPQSEIDETIAIDAMEYGRVTPVTSKFLTFKSRTQFWVRQLEMEDPARRAVPEQIIGPLEEDINRLLSSELETFAQKETVVARDPTAFRVAAALLAAGLAVALAAAAVRSRRLRGDLHALRHNRMRRNEAFFGVLFAAPWFLGVACFLAFPIVFSLVLSFSDWDPYDPVAHRTFVGFDNYVKAFTADPLMWLSLRKTFTYAAIAVPITLCGGLGLALLLNQRIRGIGVFRTLFYMPNVVGGVSTTIMWYFIFNPTYGPLNGLIRSVNDSLDRTPLAAYTIPEPEWLQDPDWAMPAMILMMLWGTGGGAMLVFLAGLQGIPQQLYEAAELDGAGRLRKFWNVTLPMLTPTIYFNLVLGLIAALQVFMQAFILIGRDGGPQNQLLFFVMHLYNKAFIEYEFGYAAALAWILFVIILGFTMLVIRSSALWVYYEGERGR